jgi:micrococcal nuclease
MREALCIAAALILFGGVVPLSAETAKPREDRQTLYGTVTEVVDAETLEVRVEGEDGKELNQIVHLNGINGPEKSEPEYEEAKAFTEKLVLEKRVKLITRGLDAYQRVLAFVYVEEVSLGYELLRHGLARINAVQMGPDPALYDEYKYAQLEALFGKKGVWSEKKN